MKTSNKIKGGLTVIATYVTREFKTIATSYSILLVMIGGIFIYGLLYNYMYAPNLIRDAPVAVVDRSGTPLSREYARLLNASPQVEIYSYAPDMPSAKIMMETNRVVGIIFIPEDFESRVGRGEQAVFLAYGNTSAFLNFASVEEATAGAMEELDSRHRPDMVVFVPPAALYAMSQTQSIDIVGTPLYNPTEGYGSYLIPAVLIVILFQTLMMVIGMISGKERYTGSILYYSRHGLGFGRMAGVVLSKTFTYCILYAVFAYFLIGLLPEIYSIPDIGNRRDIVMLLIPFLLATCFFGLTGSLFFADSESPILMITFFSVGLIFLSGMSYPLELMPWYWQAAHFVIPASPGVLAFIKLNSMGAGMADIEREYVTLWIQCIVYFISACLAFRYNIRKAIRNRPAGARAASRNDVPTPAPAKGIAEPASVENTVE